MPLTAIRAAKTLEGAGFEVHRPIPSMALPLLDPFLLLDQMGPMDLAPGQAKGAPDHPHRGFETVTYMLEGEMEHRDSHGHAGKLGPGDVQWMTAGGGVIHSEMPSEAFQARGGVMHGAQLWVNLPAADKMMAPRYQEIPSASIPEHTQEGAVVRVLAGAFGDASAVIDTRTPIVYLHMQLEEGATIRHTKEAGHNGFAYTMRGMVEVGGTVARAGTLIVLPEEEVEIVAREPSDVFWITGKPIGEPVSRYGPFVMNTREEIQQAIADFNAGKFGEIPAEVGGSKPYLPGEETPS